MGEKATINPRGRLRPHGSRNLPKGDVGVDQSEKEHQGPLPITPVIEAGAEVRVDASDDSSAEEAEVEVDTLPRNMEPGRMELLSDNEGEDQEKDKGGNTLGALIDFGKTLIVRVPLDIYGCLWCNESFKGYKAFEKHVKVHDWSYSVIARCDKCGRSSRSYHSIRCHQAKCNGTQEPQVAQGEFCCGTCDAKLNSKRECLTTRGSDIRLCEMPNG